MAFNTTAASNTPDLKRLPISALHPGLPSLATQSIVAIVTLVWPYSSSTRACALLLAEPDFRLRRRRGQVRVQFFADAAEAVATSGVGIGDVVVLRLGPAVQWLQSSGEEEVVRTPGKSVEWELGYRRALRLRAWRDGEVLASLDVRGEETPDRQIEEAEEEVYNTPSKIVGRFSGEGLKMGSWASPAFLKRSRLSLDSRRKSNDLFADEDGYLEGKGRKKRKSWMNVGKWTYANRTPSPEKGDTESAEDMSPSSQMDDGIASHPAGGLNTPDSSKTPIEVDENDELVPERRSTHEDESSTNVEPPKGTWSELFSQPEPAAAELPPPKSFPEQEPVADHVEIASPSPALPKLAELSQEEAIDQHFLTEIRRSDFVESDTEENTEVDDFPSEPEDILEGQLSLKQLRAIEQDQSSTEEDEPPLLVPGAVLQTQLDDHSSDKEEDPDDGLLQVTELDRSLTPTEVDSEEEEEPESEQGEDADTQAAHVPVKSVPLGKTAQIAPKERLAESLQLNDQVPSFDEASQVGATQAMPPPLVRPIAFDEPSASTATETPPQTPRSSAIGSERAPPTPQLPPVSSRNLPLPSPFPGTGVQEPTSYMDARSLSEVQKPAKPREHQRLPPVEEEQDPKEVQTEDSVIAGLPPVDPNLVKSQNFVDGGLGGMRELPESTEQFPFGLDGSVLSRFSKPQTLDTRDEEASIAQPSGMETQRDTVPSAAPALALPGTSGEVEAKPKGAWADVVTQDELERERRQSQQAVDHLGENNTSQDTAPKVLQPLSEQPIDMTYDLPPIPSGSAPTVQDEASEANGSPTSHEAAHDSQPQSLSLEDGYVPMVDDWDMPNLASDPMEADTVDEPALPYGQDSFGPLTEDHHEMSQIPYDAVTSRRPDDNHVREKPAVESPPESSKPEVTIIDLDNDTEEDESDAEAAVPVKEATPIPVLDGKIGLQHGLESPAKPEKLESTPRTPNSRLLSPAKRPQQRGKTPSSDVDTLSQVGSTPRRPRPTPAPASQSSIADRVSNRRRRTEVKDSESEWESTATVSTQRPPSPPAEADPKSLEDNERYSTPTTTQALEELSKQPLQINWELERFSSPFTGQLLEDLSQKPIEELSQRPSSAQNELFPQKTPVSTIERLELPEIGQSWGAQSEASEKTPKQAKVQKSFPPVEQSPRAQSELCLSAPAKTSDSEAIAEAASSIHSAQRPAQESLLTPNQSQQTAYISSSIPETQVEQFLPPTRQITQIGHAAEETDLTQVKATHEERANTTMDDTTLVEPLNGVHYPLPCFSVRSAEDAKSPSPTFSERVRLYESSQADLSQRSTFAQSQGTRTSLGYFTPLSSVSRHLNSQAQVDVLAVCTRATKPPERAKSGPKDYFTSFRIADESLDVGADGDSGSSPSTTQVQVFRPWKAALPECDVGDAVLLRNFKPTSRKGKVGLSSTMESAWCVFRYGKRSSQTRRNGDVNGRVVGLQYDDSTEKSEGKEKENGDDVKKGGKKRRSNIMDSLRPIWADTMSGLWGDLTGLVEGMDDYKEDTSINNAKETQDVASTNGTNAGKAKDQVSTDLDHGRYNPESGAAREECHGPPVEYGDQERREARRLREWWVGGSGGASAA